MPVYPFGAFRLNSGKVHPCLAVCLVVTPLSIALLPREKSQSIGLTVHAYLFLGVDLISSELFELLLEIGDIRAVAHDVQRLDAPLVSELKQ